MKSPKKEACMVAPNFIDSAILTLNQSAFEEDQKVSPSKKAYPTDKISDGLKIRHISPTMQTKQGYQSVHEQPQNQKAFEHVLQSSSPSKRMQIYQKMLFELNDLQKDEESKSEQQPENQVEQPTFKVSKKTIVGGQIQLIQPPGSNKMLPLQKNSLCQSQSSPKIRIITDQETPYASPVKNSKQDISVISPNNEEDSQQQQIDLKDSPSVSRQKSLNLYDFLLQQVEGNFWRHVTIMRDGNWLNSLWPTFTLVRNGEPICFAKVQG